MVYDEWQERLQYRIDNYPGSGYVVKITVTWLPGMARDFSDARFSDNLDVKLPYWIESYTAGSSATVWVRLENSSTVYLHYGNGSAISESNGNSTFDFFDDFLTADTSKWTFPTGYYSVSDSVCYINSGTFVSAGKQIVSKKSFGINTVVRGKIKTAHSGYTSGIYERPLNYTDDSTSAILFCVVHWTTLPVLYNSNGSSTEVSVSGWSSNTWTVTELARGGTYSKLSFNSSSFTNSSHYPTASFPVTSLAYSNCGTKAEVWVDWICVRKYAATEPAAVMVSAQSKPMNLRVVANSVSSHFDRVSSHTVPIFKIKVNRGLNRVSSSFVGNLNMFARETFGVNYTAISSMTIPLINVGETKAIGRHANEFVGTVKEKGSRTLVFHRVASSYSLIAKIKDTSHGSFNRKPGMKITLYEKSTRIYHANRISGLYSGTVRDMLKQLHLHVSRRSSMSTKVDEKVTRNVHSVRTSGSNVDIVEENDSRKFDMYRYYYTGQGSFVAIPACEVTVSKTLNASASMFVGTPALLLDRAYRGFRQNREATNSIEAQDIIADWEADWNRDGLLEVLPVEIKVIPSSTRELLFSVSPVNIGSSRLVSNNMDSLLGIPAIGLKSRLGSNILRSSELKISEINLDLSRSADYHRLSGASIVTVASGMEASGLIERVATLYVDNCTVNTERVLEAVRLSSVEILEPSVIAFGAVNADRPNAPFDIDIGKSDYIITVDKPEYGLELSKNLYYAVIRDGETMIEITQYDTDTFYGYLYDTDPVSGESRAMPLSGKIVKAILKGGAPDTTVTMDCTVVEDGKVGFSLTSANTAVSGKYFLKFVVLSEGYRKEIPEVRDEYLEVQINDASYTAPT